jgi:hypothetical protein
MTRRRASRRLYAASKKVATLEDRRRALEIQALGAEASDAERRARYFSIADAALRRELIGLERSLHELREERRAAAVGYWTTVTAGIRAELADLASESRTSGWWQHVWWDVATILWILTGAGWLAYRIPGALAGAAVTAVCAWFLVRSRMGARPALIRRGEEALRASESELRLAERDAVPEVPAFSALEAETGVADPAGG